MATPGYHSAEFLTAVGRVTVAFGQMEWHVSFLTQCLMSDNQRAGQTVTASLQFSAIVDLASRLGQVRLPSADKMRELNTLLTEARALGDKRNALVHAFIGPPTADGDHIGIRLRARGREVLQVSTQVVNPAALNKVADEIDALVPRLYNFLESLPKELTANYISSAE